MTMRMREIMALMETANPVTEIPAFKAWFRDSKVVDKQGRPLVVYHGSPQMLGPDFAFDPNRKGVSTFMGIPVEVQRHGFFFATNRAFAQSFANQPRARGKGTVLDVYLSIQRPLHMTSDGVAQEDIEKLVTQGVDRNWMEKHAGDPRTTYEQFDEDDGEFFADAIKAAGFDGVLIDEEDPETHRVERVWIAFSPSQIKSVEATRFDPDSPRLAEDEE